ncbi:hypothetical protein BCR34DRAFT_596734 [Clohesyomyces aquaticus]|uniref:NACHT domain-containing protein n=1 Tax=Clohesyomyces aquaticus TaxID=1231657 RepID=A0A1Y2A6E2_9PLEO|nr:hypothetical protein BCR34DRAFT_596734 [Clohesyomyces aquaticus]
MLDPVSAVGVASAAVQFVDFSTKLFAVGKELHGTKLSTRPPAAAGATQEEQDLYRLADLCQQECNVFLAKIGKITGKSGTKRTFKTFRDALKIVWNQKAIDGLEKRLERYQRELTLALISHLGNGQSSITRGLQALIADNRRVESSQKRQINDIVNLLTDIQKEQKSHRNATPGNSNSSSHIGHLAMKLPWAFHVASQMILQQRFLGSLYFSSLKLRHSRIETAHDRTFKWLFQRSRKIQNQVDPKVRFLRWLQSGDGIFWISGKPGSGKSTLMKYITGSPHTKKALFEWANPDAVLNGPQEADSSPRMTFFSRQKGGESEESRSDGEDESGDGGKNLEDAGSDFGEEIGVVTASFYFWSAGTSMQKSQQGLFQSLLYEIFSHAPDLMQKACPKRWQSIEQAESQEPWTIEEIADTIKRTIALATDSVRFCFFVDGIDEYVGDHHEMVRLLESFARLPNVKLCVSSRPWNVFEDTFGQDSERKFYLQDLTRGDIDRYVRSKLRQHPAWKALTHDDARYKAIANEIVEKAQGVFLWVFLVVRSLLEGLSNGDTMSLLQDRLRRIPTDLREFFKYMLDSLDPIYNQRVAHFFLAALDSAEPLPLMTYAYFDEEFDDPNYVFELDNKALETYDLIPRHKQTGRQLNGRCKGLLEMYRDTEGIDFFRYRVGFLHRTVRDFFLTQEIRQEFENRLPSTLQICNSLLKASIAMLKKSPRVGEDTGRSPRFRYLVDLALHSTRRAELASGKPAIKLLDEMAYVLNDVGFYKSYWGATSGTPSVQDCFLGLAIERGLLLYTSDQLDYRSRTPISSRRLHLGDMQRRCLLDHALALPKSNSFDEPDVSDVVKYLLTKGCDPNDLNDGQTPFSQFLQRLSKDDGGKDAATLKSTGSCRLKILKHLLTHGADPNFGVNEGSWALWATFLQRLYEGSMIPKHMCQYYLDIVELLLSFGANPNLPATGVCSCCPIFTPWTHFIKWGWKMQGFRAISFHQQEFLARLCTLLLEHGADPTISFPRAITPSSKTKDSQTVVSPPLSLADIIRQGFPARLSAPILATLPLEVRNEVDCSEKAAAPVRRSEEPLRVAHQSTVSVWNLLSWWNLLRPAQSIITPAMPDTEHNEGDGDSEYETSPEEEADIPDHVVSSLADMGFRCSPSKLPPSLLLALENRFSGADLAQRNRTAEMHPHAKPTFLVGPCMFPGILCALIKECATGNLEWYASDSVRHVVEVMTPAKLKGYRVQASHSSPWPALVLSGSRDAKDTVTGLLFFNQNWLLRQKLRELQVANGFRRSTDQAIGTVEVETSEGTKFLMTADIVFPNAPKKALITADTKLWDPARMLIEKKLKPLFDSVREEERELKQGRSGMAIL